MAGITGFDFQQVIRNTQKLKDLVRMEAVEAAQKAAADYMKAHIEAASPVGTRSRPATARSPAHQAGQLRKSVAEIKRREERSLTVTSVTSIMVGPNRPKGYHGFWLQEGRIPTNIRRKRAATATSHSQSGAVVNRRKVISYPNWFNNAVDASAMGAEKAGADAFDKKLQEILTRTGMS